MAKLKWVLDSASGNVEAQKASVLGFTLREHRASTDTYYWSLQRNGVMLGVGFAATSWRAEEEAEQALADHLRQYVPLMQTLGVVE